MLSRGSESIYIIFPAVAVILFSGTLYAQTFENIPSISFTKVAGGADPLPQVLTAATTGVPVNFTFAATTQSGGNWLSASSALDCSTCTTPNVVIAKVTASPTLAVGSYAGQIVLMVPGGSGSLTINVTLTVAPAGGSFFDDVPGQLSFTSMTGSGTPPSQRIQIRNGGTGTLTWNLTASTFNGGNWLNVSAASGTASSFIDVSVSIPNLPGGGLNAGSFIGQLLFTAAGSSVTIPICVVVGPDIFSQVNPISFTKPYGGANPLPQTLTIASPGPSFEFTFGSTTATGGDWLFLSSAGDCDVCATPSVITAAVAASSTLAPGTYTGEIVMTEYSDPATAITIPVTLTVGPPGGDFFDDVSGQLTFSLVTAGGNPPVQTVDIRDFGSGLLNWNVTASTADGGNWLIVSNPPNGTTPSLVNIGVQVSNLPNAGLVPGTFVGQLFFQANESSVTVPISVQVGPDVFSQVNPISFTKPYAGADPLPQTLTIGGTGASFSFTFTSSTATGGDWLSVSSALNCVSCSTPNVLTATVTTSPTLAPGTYTGQIVVTNSSGSATSMTIPVTLTVGPAGGNFFDNLPGQLTFSLQTSTEIPPSQTVQIRNAGSGPLNWTLTTVTADGGNWLNASALSGTAPSTVSITVSPQSLPNAGLDAGPYIGELFFEAAGSSVTIPVNVLVGASVFNQVNPISFTMPFAGANPLPQILTIANTGASFNFTYSSSTATGGNWLSVTSAVNCNPCATPNVITATVNASPTLAPGTYTGQIVLSGYSDPATSLTVPVSLTVGAAGGSFFDNVQGQLSFFMTPGGVAPAGQTVQLRNGGVGALNWVALATTSDGGTWLTLSQTSGAAPSTVTVGVATQRLPSSGLVAGVFTGQVMFVSDSGSVVTVPVLVQVDPNTFAPTAALSFTESLGASNPLTQSFTINSGGSAFNFTVASYTGAGGNWLSVAAADGCAPCATPDSITATVTTPASLPAGTYTGEIVYTAYSDPATAMTMPVILSVGGPFSLNPASANPPASGGAASVAVNATSQSAAWTAVSDSSFITVTSGARGTGDGTVNYTVAANTGPQRAGTITIAGLTFTVTQAAGGHPAFFTGEVSLGSSVYYLQLPDGSLFGYYNYQDFPPIIFHYDMGFEAFIDANDGQGDAYLYDFASGHWFYTGPSFFPNLYDFTLNSWLYYFPDTSKPGHYTVNPRYFVNLATGKIFSM